MFKTASGTTSTGSCVLHKFGHFMASSVVNESSDKGKLYVIFFLQQTQISKWSEQMS